MYSLMATFFILHTLNIKFCLSFIRFGFLDIDMSVISWRPHLNLLSQVFIHHSGCALIQPVYDSQRRASGSPYEEDGLDSKF